MEKLKLVHQLFIGKVADEIGMERTTELLKEAKEALNIPIVVGQIEQLSTDIEIGKMVSDLANIADAEKER